MNIAVKRINSATNDPVASLDAVSERVVGDSLRLAMRELASGVCIVTSGAGDTRSGLTATSVTSLSLAPASILVCVQKNSKSLDEIIGNDVFAVNILSGTQQAAADDFASRGVLKGLMRFGTADWVQGALNVPVLTSALASLECRVGKVVDWHTHLVLFGLVQSIHFGGRGAALTYWRGRYCQAGMPDPDGAPL